MYKIIGADGKEYGPVSADQINQWIVQNRVNAQTRVQADGGEWKPLSDFPEFASSFASRMPPLPSVASPGIPARPPVPVKTSGMAIASLVLALLTPLCGITALIGLILGILAINRIKKSNGTLGGFGLALSGTIVSVFFILLLPLIIALFVPALAKAKQKATSVQCMNNMRQMAIAVRMYSADHSNRFPSAENWCDALKAEMASSATPLNLEVPLEKNFQCPAATNGERCHYAFNASLDGIDDKDINPSTVLFFETDGGWNVSGGPELMLRKSRHGHVFMVAFADGHVEAVTTSRLAELRWNP